MIEVVSIGITTIDWATYLRITNDTLGRSVTKQIDAHNFEIGNLLSFFASLGELKSQGQNPNTIIREAGNLLDFGSWTIALVTTNQITYRLQSETRLNFVSTKTIEDNFLLSVISGSFADWRTAIINCSSSIVNSDIRLFANKCMALLDSLGLWHLFAQFSKIPMQDGTLRLSK